MDDSGEPSLSHPLFSEEQLVISSLHTWRTEQAHQYLKGSARGTGWLWLAAVPSADTLPQRELSLSSRIGEAQVPLPSFDPLWQSSEGYQGAVETPVKQQQVFWAYVSRMM